MNKKDILNIINTYQNYYNDFVNVNEKDLNNIYEKINMEIMNEGEHRLSAKVENLIEKYETKIPKEFKLKLRDIISEQ
jgi:hypothetical protein|tara:strand:- start:341 stop:574 length:234 start_codon:yes stop_codon:yes gene_type:complete